MNLLRLSLTGLILLSSLPAQAQPAAPLTLALGGDMIGPYQPLARADTKGFAPIAELFARADMGIANFEGASFDHTQFPGVASAETGGGYPVIAPANVEALARSGIRLVAKANNHGTDWGYIGLAATLATLRDKGIAQAGAGRNLEEAAAPAYVDTPHGRVALISVASTFTPMGVAGAPVQRGGRDFDRPGINALHVHEVRLVTPAQLKALRAAAGPVAIKAAGDEVRIGDQVFRAAPRPGLRWEADPQDVARIMAAIRTARAHARVVVFSIHAHETAGHTDDMPPGPFETLALHRANEVPSPDDPRPAAFLRPLFHQAVDAGADVVLRSGPHVIGGIEVYRGKPLFYGLGSLFFSFGGQRSYKAPGGQIKSFPEGWFQTVVPVLRFGADGTVNVDLHPAAIHSSKDATDGLPEVPSPQEAHAILDTLRARSAAWGTHLDITGDKATLALAH